MSAMTLYPSEAPATVRETGRSWSFAVEMKSEWLTASRDAGKFAGAERARITQEWRNSAYEAAWIAGLPTDLACIHVAAAARFRRSGKPLVTKPESLRPTLRAILSGLGPEERYLRQGRRFVAKGWGLIAKVDDRHIAYSNITFGEWILLDSTSAGQMLVTVTEVQPPPRGTADLPYRPRRGARGVCRECDLEDLKLTPNGLVWAHRVRRIAPDGIEYLTDEKCPGGGQLPVPEESQ